MARSGAEWTVEERQAWPGLASSGWEWQARLGDERRRLEWRGRNGTDCNDDAGHGEAGVADPLDRLTLRLALLSCVNG